MPGQVQGGMRVLSLMEDAADAAEEFSGNPERNGSPAEVPAAIALHDHSSDHRKHEREREQH